MDTLIASQAGTAGNAVCEYLTFAAAGQEYGIDILAVREIRGWTVENPLPNCPPSVRGVINLRGQVVPIYDLRIRLGAERSTPTATHVVIVVEAAAGFYGLLVDAVSDIMSVANGELQPVPQTGMAAENAFLTALLPRDTRMVSLLDLDLLVGGRAPEFEDVSLAAA
ncbi:MAG: chemotaxis protein CheW [Ferrovibrio sp.]|uniref:chemotaxis protein CheW n=1 Tax=Ferrovibrio sp. TaxID=1917215 RepID=UPI00261D0F4F|nr:chemotaxis protein CheW [Ferrovibrio sp.]MCW0232578.1 chemotaxis protein CheW [Ferrovibrio sp.]